MEFGIQEAMSFDCLESLEFVLMDRETKQPVESYLIEFQTPSGATNPMELLIHEWVHKLNVLTDTVCIRTSFSIKLKRCCSLLR